MEITKVEINRLEIELENSLFKNETRIFKVILINLSDAANTLSIRRCDNSAEMYKDV